MIDSNAAISVRGVSKIYEPSPSWMRLMVRTVITDPIHALNGVTFDVNEGQIVAVVGPNGAGKTTLFRILVGLTTPSKGDATVMGYDAERQSRSIRRLVGWMPAEDRSLQMRLSCWENLYFHGRLRGLRGPWLRTRIGESLELVGLGHAARHSVLALSAGMKARLQLARAILHEPRVLILDEPTGSVDPVGSHELLEVLMAVVDEQKLAALISSHRLEEIETLHSRVILLDHGQVRYFGNLNDLRRRWERPGIELQFRSQEAATEASRLIAAPGIGDPFQPQNGLVTVMLEDSMAIGEVLNAVQDVLPDLVHLREVRAPLLSLLASIYQSEGTDRGGEWKTGRSQ